MRALLLFISVLSLVLVTSCSKQEYTEEFIEPVSYTPEKFDSFIFVGADKKNYSLYRYNIHTGSTEEIWNAGKEKIVEFSYSSDRRSAFFITAASTGKDVFPHLNKAGIYVINNDSIVHFIQDAGSGIQIFAKWETNNAFRVFINKLILDNPATVEQRSQIFNTYGKLFEEEVRSFDLIREGYPQPVLTEIDLDSPNKDYSLVIKQASTDSIFLKFSDSENEVFITASGQLDKVSWSPDNLYAAINLITAENENNSARLILYSIRERKIIEEWICRSSSKHLLVNNLLIFDTEIKDIPAVILYDLDKNQPVDTIKMTGGTGLSSL